MEGIVGHHVRVDLMAETAVYHADVQRSRLACLTTEAVFAPLDGRAHIVQSNAQLAPTDKTA